MGQAGEEGGPAPACRGVWSRAERKRWRRGWRDLPEGSPPWMQGSRGLVEIAVDREFRPSLLKFYLPLILETKSCRKRSASTSTQTFALGATLSTPSITK